MTTHDFQRARSEEQVQQRRDDIVEVARALLESSGVNGVTLMAVGKGVGLAKSNIYRYFESREDILCEVFVEESETLVEELCSSFESLPRPNDFAGCAAVFSNACAGRPLFCLLHTKMAGTLEENVSIERLVELKTEFARLTARTAKALWTAAPDLGPDGAGVAIRMFLHHLAGSWPFGHLGDNARKAIEEAGLKQYQQPFRKSFAQSCYVILKGVHAAQREQTA